MHELSQRIVLAARDGFAWRLLALLVIPFLFIPWIAETRELPRHTVVQVVSFAGLAIAVWHGRLQRSGMVPVLAFAAMLVLATINGESPWRSFFGPYEGHLGTLAWLAYLGLVINAPKIKWLPYWSAAFLVVSCAQAAVAIVQRLVYAQQPTGTMGHIMFLAAITSMGALTAMGWVIDARKPYVQAIAAGGGWLCVAALAATGRRGPVLALIVGTLIVFWLSGQRRRLLIFVIGAVTLLVTVGAVSTLPRQSATLLNRLTETAPVSYDTIRSRGDFYRAATVAIAERPTLGWGFGSFRDVYAVHKAPDIPNFEVRPHSIWLHIALATGLIGLALFVWLLRHWGLAILQAVRQQRDSPHSGKIVAAAAVVAAYMVHLSFNFDQPAIGAWMAALAGILVNSTTTGYFRTPLPPIRRTAIAGFLVVMTSLPLVAFTSDAWVGIALGQERQGRHELAAQFFRNALALPRFECTYVLRFVVALRQTNKRASRSERVSLLEACAAREPLHAYLHYHLGLAHLDADPANATSKAHAIVSLERAVRLVPSHGTFRQSLGKALAIAGDPHGALRQLHLAIAVDPKDAGFHNDRGNIHMMLGRLRVALDDYQTASQLAPKEAIYLANYDELYRRLHP